MKLWPPFLRTPTAVQYTQRTRWTLARAVRDGDLPIAGRNGRSLVFRREDLDAWLVGDVGNTNASARSVAKHGRAVPRSAGATGNALERLARIRRGQR